MKNALILLLVAAIIGLAYKQHQLEENIHGQALERFALGDKLAEQIKKAKAAGGAELLSYAQTVDARLRPLEDQRAALVTTMRRAAEEDALALIGEKIWTPVTDTVVRDAFGKEIAVRTSLCGSHIYAGALTNKSRVRVRFTLRDDQPEHPLRVTDIVRVEYE